MALPPSQPPLPELESILSMLSAFAHRNKNQHRLSKWWKSFSQLRRQISSLISELRASQGEEKKYGARNKKAVAARQVVEGRTRFIAMVLMPRVYLYVKFA